jgi:hypothetical protein
MSVQVNLLDIEFEHIIHDCGSTGRRSRSLCTFSSS